MGRRGNAIKVKGGSCGEGLGKGISPGRVSDLRKKGNKNKKQKIEKR